MFSTRTLTLGLCCAAMGTAAVASADEKIISGAACSARNPETDNVILSSNGIEAQATTVDVYCPLVRDTTNELSLVEVGFSELVVGPGFNGSVSCDLIARTLDNTGSDIITVNGTLLNLTGAKVSFASQLANLTEGTNRMYIVKCTLDDEEILSGIRWDE